MGIQSGSSRTKKLYQRHHSNESVQKAVQQIYEFKDKIKKIQFDIILDNPWESDQDLRSTLRFLSHFPVPYQLILFPLMFYPGTDLYDRALREGMIPSNENEIDRTRHHQFKPTYLNKLFFLLDECAQRGVRISPLAMFLLTHPAMVKMGLSALIISHLRNKLENAPQPLPQTGESYIDFSLQDFSRQLGTGWYAWEKEGGGAFRWTARRTVFYLFPQGGESYLEIRGTIPDLANYRRSPLKLKVYQGRQLIYKNSWTQAGILALKILLAPPVPKPGSPCCFHLELNATFSPDRLEIGRDTRDLGILITSLRLA
jgi:hypothetical protein